MLIEQGFVADDVLESRRVLGDLGAGGRSGRPGRIRGLCRDESGAVELVAPLKAGAARMRDFDALVIPGGRAPDRMRLRHAMVDLVSEAMVAGKPLAAIGHGPQLLITASVLRGRTLTCWPSIAVDVKNAGGLYVDRPVVRDANLITSRKAADLPMLLEALVTALSEPPAPA